MVRALLRMTPMSLWFGRNMNFQFYETFFSKICWR